MLPLKQDTTRKEQINKNAIKLDSSKNNSKKYRIKTIYDNAVYRKKLKDYLPGHTIWFFRKVTQKKKIPESFINQFST